VICEILNDDGTMARVADLIQFCQRHDLLMITVADLVRYRAEGNGDRLPDRVLSRSGPLRVATGARQ
jgi:3,4-dihydroxy 2-butanone 4-phosphate synthase/GTP cyclohydrolase II